MLAATATATPIAAAADAAAAAAAADGWLLMVMVAVPWSMAKTPLSALSCCTLGGYISHPARKPSSRGNALSHIERPPRLPGAAWNSCQNTDRDGNLMF